MGAGKKFVAGQYRFRKKERGVRLPNSSPIRGFSTHPEHNPDTCLESDRPNHSPIPRIS